jgi:hypothetical protein
MRTHGYRTEELDVYNLEVIEFLIELFIIQIPIYLFLVSTGGKRDHCHLNMVLVWHRVRRGKIKRRELL